MIEYDFSMIRPALIKMLKVNMGLKDRERVLFLSDVPKIEEWYHSYAEISDFTLRSLMIRQAYDIASVEFPDNQVDYFVYESCGRHGVEPPCEVAAKMLDYDVIIVINTYSLSHTNARLHATKNGARIASCANLDFDMLYPNGVIDTDYRAIDEKSRKIADLLTPADNVRLTTPDGTDLTFSLQGRKGLFDNGLYIEKGNWGNLPGGEAYITPIEGTANGRVFVPAGWFENLQENMIMEFIDGEVISIDGGGEVGDYYREFIFSPDSPKHRRCLAELGIGTNDKAKKPDCVLESEKIGRYNPCGARQ